MSRGLEEAGRDPYWWLAALDPLAYGDLRSRVLAVAALLALSVLPVVILAPLFQAPFEPDEGVYATIARGWLEGAIPYRDLWDNKGPLLFLWYAASFQWLGETVVAPRLLAGLAAGLGVPFVWATARTLLGQREATVAAALFALSFLNLYIQVTANSEIFMLLPLSAGLWSFAVGARRGGLRWFLAAGALTALAMFTRQSALWAFLGYGAWFAALFFRSPPERPGLTRAAGSLGLGAVLGSLPFFIYFAAHGAAYDLWHAMFEFNWEWTGQRAIYWRLIPPLFANPIPLLGGLAFWLLAAVGIWRLLVRGDRWSWLLLSFLAFSEIGAQTTGKFFPHYTVQLLPGTALAGAVGLLYVMERWRAGRKTLALSASAAAAITVAGAVLVYAQPTAEERFEVQYAFRDNAQDTLTAAEIAAAVERMTEPGDYVYEWGRESEIYWLADREPASRWLHNRPYTVDESVIKEVIADLNERQPKVILFTLEEEQIVEDTFAPPPELREYVNENYIFVGRVVYADIYRLRDG